MSLKGKSISVCSALTAAVVLWGVSSFSGQALADNLKDNRIAALKTMAGALRHAAELVNAKRELAGLEKDEAMCPTGFDNSCREEEKIAVKCGFPDATPDGIVRALNADLGKIVDGRVPDNKWVYVFKEWDKDARQILVTLNGAPVPDAFEAGEDLTVKHQCYIFYNTPCYQDPRDTKHDGNLNGIQIRLFTDGC